MSSERSCFSSVALNMAISYTKAYKDSKKLEHKISVREGIFIRDYMKTKYPLLYQEAADLYNSINRENPCKPNLTKTTQYRMWKNDIARQNQQPTQHVPRQRDRYLKPTDYPEMTAEEPNNNIRTSKTTPRRRLTGTRQFLLEIPLIPQHNIVITPPNQQAETNTIQEVDQPETQVIQEGNEQPGSHQQEDGGLDENLSPSVFDDIPHNVVDKIISDLRSDPDLRTIMDGIQNQDVHGQIMDLEINFPDLEDPLQQEMDELDW